MLIMKEMKMKKILAMSLLLILAASMAGAQEGMVLISGGYFQQNNSYEKITGLPYGLPPVDFTDAIRSFGLGVTQFIRGGSPVGFYSGTHLLFPIDLVRTVSGSKTTLSIKDFRFGIDTINGVGFGIQPGRIGFLLGAGVHLSYMLLWNYPDSADSRFNLINIGLGGGGHVYFILKDNVSLQLGTVWWYDFFQPRYSYLDSISNSYSYSGGWGYQVTLGVGLAIEPGKKGR